MDDIAVEVFHRNQGASVDRLTAHLSDDKKCRELSKQELENKFPQAIRAWETYVEVDESIIDLIVVLDNHYPFTLPAIYVKNPNILGKHPHIVSNGRLCITGDEDSFDPFSVEHNYDHLLKMVEDVLKSAESEEAKNDFLDEFEAYWMGQSIHSDSCSLSLCTPATKTRQITHVKVNDYYIFADDESTLNRWLQNRNYRYAISNARKSILIALDCPLLPEDYPQSNKDILKFLNSDSEIELLNQIIPKDLYNLPILFSLKSENVTAFAALELQEPVQIYYSGGKQKTRRSKLDGFKKNAKIPTDVLSSRYLNNTPAIRLRLQRVDNDWIHRRGGSDQSEKLLNSHACLIGCGSLGSAVAIQLAKAGVGKFTLIDNDTLSWNNIGRHVLGANYVGYPKALAMKNYICSQLPHANVKSFEHQWWHEAYLADKSNFLNSNIIIATTGSWGVDNSLNEFMKNGPHNIPIIFAWLEPFACAGHALVVMNNGGCLHCGMNKLGSFKYEATTWKTTTKKRSGACGEFYQPYGLTDAIPIQHMITQVASEVLIGKIHQSTLFTWLGTNQNLSDCGGDWSQALDHNKNSSYATVRKIIWPIDVDCKICNV